jgi:uncharacterized Zn finger protein
LTLPIVKGINKISHTTKEVCMIANHTRARVDTDRLQRGVEGLASGAYAITVTRFTDDEISAQVANGDGKSYPVTLTAIRSFCGRSDSQFRGKTCKHATALALYVIRTPKTAMQVEMPSPPDLTLKKQRPGWNTSMI